MPSAMCYALSGLSYSHPLVSNILRPSIHLSYGVNMGNVAWSPNVGDSVRVPSQSPPLRVATVPESLWAVSGGGGPERLPLDACLGEWSWPNQASMTDFGSCIWWSPPHVPRGLWWWAWSYYHHPRRRPAMTL